nr:hypothetical protein [Fodinibius sp.]
MFKHVSKEEVVIPATMGHLRDVREFIEHVGKKHKYADKVINSFKLVVDEACTNIIRHGYMDIKDGKITVRAIIRRMSLTMVIIDQGKSFDPRQVKNPDLGKYVEIGKKGGLGIFMMRKLMDDIQYNLTNRGNELRLTKMRDVELKRHRVLTWFDSLSLRRKSFIITSVSIVLLTIATYFVLESQIYSNIKEEVFTEATAITKNYADINWEPLNNENDILLFENAKSVKENHGEMIRFSMVTTSDYEVMAVFPLNLNLVSKNFDLQHSEPIEEVNNVSVYQTSILDTSVYYFIAPIELKNIAEEPIGYAVLWIEESYIGNKASSAKTDLAILLLVGCVGATIG